jgi:hypothetical protein
MVLQGTQVDAREWWDPHWIHDRIQAKLEEFGPAQRKSAEAAENPQRPQRTGKVRR